MRAAIVKLSVIESHRWKYLNAGEYLGNVERSADDLERAYVQFKKAETRLRNAKNEHDRQLRNAEEAERSGKIMPLRVS